MQGCFNPGSPPPQGMAIVLYALQEVSEVLGDDKTWT